MNSGLRQATDKVANSPSNTEARYGIIRRGTAGSTVQKSRLSIVNTAIPEQDAEMRQKENIVASQPSGSSSSSQSESATAQEFGRRSFVPKQPSPAALELMRLRTPRPMDTVMENKNASNDKKTLQRLSTIDEEEPASGLERPKLQDKTAVPYQTSDSQSEKPGSPMPNTREGFNPQLRRLQIAQASQRMQELLARAESAGKESKAALQEANTINPKRLLDEDDLVSGPSPKRLQLHSTLATTPSDPSDPHIVQKSAKRSLEEDQPVSSPKRLQLQGNVTPPQCPGSSSTLKNGYDDSTYMEASRRMQALIAMEVSAANENKAAVQPPNPPDHTTKGALEEDEPEMPQMDGPCDDVPPPSPSRSRNPWSRLARNRASPYRQRVNSPLRAQFHNALAIRPRVGPSGHGGDFSVGQTYQAPNFAHANVVDNRYEDGEVRRYGAGESYRPYNRDRSDRSPRPRSPVRDRGDRGDRGRTPPVASDSYVPGRSPRRRSRSADRGDRYRDSRDTRDRDRSRDGRTWRRDRSRSRPRSPIRRASPPRRSPPRRSPPRYGSPRRDERPRSPRRDYDRDRDMR